MWARARRAIGEDSVQIHLLGTGTPTPSLRRMCSGYVIEVGDDVVVFDHGFGAHHRLLELGIAATRVTHLFFTHLHYDHFGDYDRLVLTRWDQGAGAVPELKVFGPPPMAQVTERLFGRGGVYDADLNARTKDRCSLSIYEARGGIAPRSRPYPKVREIASGATVEEHGWSVRAAAGRHFEPYLNCYGFRFEKDGFSFVYSGDSGPSAAITELASDCDVLVHMCHYVSGTQLNDAFAESCMGHIELARMARDANVKSLVLTHITEQFDKPGLRERVVAEMAEVFRGAILFGEDLMGVPVSPPDLAQLM